MAFKLLRAFGAAFRRRWCWRSAERLFCSYTIQEDTERLIYPCTIQENPKVILDKVCDSMYYLWFDSELAHDIVMIRIQRICWETQRRSGKRIHVDNGYIDQGRIVIRVNLAQKDDGGRAFWRAIVDITRVLCTTTDVEQRNNFLSDLEESQRGSSR